MPIDWNFDAEVPTFDLLEELDLDDAADLNRAFDRFTAEMELDRFRTWEAVIRREQGLACTVYLSQLADESLDFGAEDDRVLCINDVPRFQEPWYETLRKFAPRLLREPFVTSDYHHDGASEIWPPLVAAVENRGRGLSLPQGVSQPLYVLPAELRHKLWLQCCFGHLAGLGQADDLTLANDGQLDRIDWFIGNLRAQCDSVRFLNLNLTSLLQQVELPEHDRTIFVRVMCERLGLDSPDAPLAPQLGENPAIPSERVDRVPVDVIKQAIVHPDPAVREMAADYFADGYSPDPAVMPLIIQAVEQFGWDDAFPRYGLLDKRVHTQETVAWMVRQLPDLGIRDDDIQLDLTYALSRLDPVLLEPHERNIKRIRNVDHGMILARLNSQRLDRDKLWERFAQYVAHPFDEYPVFPETESLCDIVVLLGEDERIVAWILDTLARGVDDPLYNVWLEGVAVQMAGELKLQASVPYLVSALYDDEDDLNEDAIGALIQIGTDGVTAALAEKYPTSYGNFRRCAVAVVEDIHTNASAATLLVWHRSEFDEAIRQRILRALLNGLVPAAIEMARQELAAADRLTPELKNLRIELVALSTLAGAEFPQLEKWRVGANEDYFGDESEENELHEDDDEREEEPSDPDNTIVNVVPKIGRNDPCPCGSGKKYKKCCIRKQITSD